MATKSSSKKSSSRKSTQSAATKASKAGAKGQDATKTPAKASKSSKVDHRRPAVMPGDLAGAEYNPARTEEGERVAQTGMNPRASRAGLLVHLPSLAAEAGADPKDVPSEIAVVDGRAQLSINRTVNQSQLIALQKQLNQVKQDIT
jgi:hypothetical protein